MSLAVGSHEAILMIGGARRNPDRLDEVDAGPALPIAAIVEAARAVRGASGWWLAGGEPTLRDDLPQMISALAGEGAPSLGLCTDGLALGGDGVARDLLGAGLRRVRVPFHAARADAHDWLVGVQGAARQVRRAIGACREAGVAVEIETVVTRPTVPYLAETVEVASRLGVGSVRLRRLRARGAAAANMVALGARLGLAEPYIEEAVRAGERFGVRVVLEGFPACAAPGVQASRLPVDAEAWVLPKGAVAPPEAPSAGQCALCPGPPVCLGAPADYVERFGWTEFRSEGVAVTRANPATTRASAAPPPPRAGRPPQTRLRFAVRQSARQGLGGDPLAGLSPGAVPESIRLSFYGPSRVACSACADPGPERAESTRDARARMGRAAQEGARVLRVASAGSLAHPSAADLLLEMTRLSAERVEAAGEASALGDLSDPQVRALRRLDRVDAAIYGPDAARHDAHVGRTGAFDSTVTGLERLRKLAGVETGAFAVLHDASAIDDLARAWEKGALPGSPAFRLSARGDSLDALADAARALDPGPARNAIARVLPPCLLDRDETVSPALAAEPAAWGEEPAAWRAPSGSDARGTYEPCPHARDCAAATRCPGLASGWASARVAPIPRARTAEVA